MTKLQVLDDIIKLEDDFELETSLAIKQKVIDNIKQKYGDFGYQVANQYYSDNEIIPQDDDCPECAEKAKKLIELMNMASSISSSLTDEKVKQYHLELDKKCQINSLVADLVDTIKRRLGEKSNDLLIYKSLMLSLLTQIDENENKRRS